MSMAEITLNGKKYKVEVINHERYVDGMKVSEFLEKMMVDGNWTAISDLATLGMQIVKTGVDSPQKFVKELHEARNN